MCEFVHIVVSNLETHFSLPSCGNFFNQNILNKFMPLNQEDFGPGGLLCSPANNYDKEKVENVFQLKVLTFYNYLITLPILRGE